MAAAEATAEWLPGEVEFESRLQELQSKIADLGRLRESLGDRCCHDGGGLHSPSDCRFGLKDRDQSDKKPLTANDLQGPAPVSKSLTFGWVKHKRNTLLWDFLLPVSEWYDCDLPVNFPENPISIQKPRREA